MVVVASLALLPALDGKHHRKSRVPCLDEIRWLGALIRCVLTSTAPPHHDEHSDLTPDGAGVEWAGRDGVGGNLQAHCSIGATESRREAGRTAPTWGAIEVGGGEVGAGGPRSGAGAA